MKKTIVLSILSLSLLTFSCNENAAKKINDKNVEMAKQRDDEIKEGGPKLNFDKTEHDFGVINEGDVVETVFSFTNSGNSELIITSAKGSCGCTVPEWPKEPIAAGGSGEIRVKFDSKNKPNLQTKYVSINANTKPEVTRLKITGNVIPADDSNS